MSKLKGRQNVGFIRFVRAALHHHQGIATAADNQVEVALLLLLVGGVDDELAVDSTHAYRGDRSEKRDFRNRQRRGGADEGRDVGRIHTVRGKNRRHDLGVVVVAVGKKWPNGAVDETTDQHLSIRQARFALEKATGNLARSGGLFDEINRQRKEVDARAG